MTARIIHDMPAAEYHALDAISASELRQAHKSGVHWLEWSRTRGAGKEPSKAMRIGTLAHTAILEPDDFSRIVTEPDVNARTNEGKAALAAFRAAAAEAGQTSADADELATAVAIRDAVLAYRPHPDAEPRTTLAHILPRFSRELTILWTGDDGVERKARLDLYDSGVVADLKTCSESSPRAFARSVSDLGYHIQAAHYLAACRAAGLDANAFAFIAVESGAPHAVAMYTLPAAVVARGERDATAALVTIANAVRGDAQSYVRGIAELSIPWLE